MSTGGQYLCPDGLVKKRPGTNGMRSLSGARKQKPRKGSLAVGGAVIKADTGDRGGVQNEDPRRLTRRFTFFLPRGSTTYSNVNLADRSYVQSQVSASSQQVPRLLGADT